jgi:HNH endonuclease
MMTGVHATPAARLAKNLKTMPSGCIEWTGCLTADGYGAITVNGRGTRTHRVNWELTNGPIPPDMFVCHHCDNPPCCNVDHLFLGTHADNMADMRAKGRQAANWYQKNKTHCPQGHEYTEANTNLTPDNKRRCRTCRTAQSTVAEAVRKPWNYQPELLLAKAAFEAYRDQL